MGPFTSPRSMDYHNAVLVNGAFNLLTPIARATVLVFREITRMVAVGIGRRDISFSRRV